MSDLLAIDGDGVVVDYRQAYPVVWKKAFGAELPMVRPDAYHAHNAYGIVWESPAQEEHFFRHFDDEAWSTMPAMEGVLDACNQLVKAGHTLVCVTSMNPRFADARRQNFRTLGLPVSEVYAVKRLDSGNPKLKVLHELGAAALVDDLLDNFEGLADAIHRAYIDYGRYDAPGIGSTFIRRHSTHSSLLDFARYWLSPERKKTSQRVVGQLA